MATLFQVGRTAERAVCRAASKTTPVVVSLIPRSVLWTVADQLADECRVSPDGGHDHAILICRIFLLLNQAAPLRGAGSGAPRAGLCALGRPPGALAPSHKGAAPLVCLDPIVIQVGSVCGRLASRPLLPVAITASTARASRHDLHSPGPGERSPGYGR